jgi:hypothetical protein
MSTSSRVQQAICRHGPDYFIVAQVHGCGGATVGMLGANATNPLMLASWQAPRQNCWYGWCEAILELEWLATPIGNYVLQTNCCLACVRNGHVAAALGRLASQKPARCSRLARACHPHVRSRRSYDVTAGQGR